MMWAANAASKATPSPITVLANRKGNPAGIDWLGIYYKSNIRKP